MTQKEFDVLVERVSQDVMEKISQDAKSCYVCEGREPTVYDELKGNICERHQREKIRARLVAKQK